MKKKVFAALLLAGMVLGTGQTAFAEISVGDNNTIIDNGDGKESDKLKKGYDIPVKGTLGVPDVENPDENIPEGDIRWIKVEIPTQAFFRTDGKNPTISSDAHDVKNLSGRPVKLSLANFTEAAPGQKGVKELNFKSLTDTKTVPLVKNSAIATITETELAKVPAKTTTKTSVYSFGYTGTADFSGMKKDKPNYVNYKMTLKFEALNKNGESVVKP
ncbi:TPA: hypothetical protein I0H06_RS09025 [Enterococcus faecalis]|nr:hypothetical protein [Enterococcus faecalis]HBI1786114.1 hypothetical protein [Enterococcus faecalis]HBI1791389.1 hypothetical protein [Enterococcus faecalis]HBI1887156.1 hypothetical protein [Enterococcus faecalis]HBI1897194.1 hypothetical protein [Enterococcus faecalis]